MQGIGIATLSAKNIPALTGIRAIAALLVLGIHVDQNVPTGIVSYLPFIGRGYLGVDFFFVLSGFIITHVYLASFRNLTWSALRIFLWHRLIRLYPVHIAVLLVMIAMVWIAKAGGREISEAYFQPEDLIWHFLLLQAWGFVDVVSWNAPSWSISAEWFAYLLFPLMAPVLLFVRHWSTAIVLAIAALVIMTLICVATKWNLNSFVGAPALLRVTCEFVCGAGICRFVTLISPSDKSRWIGDVVATVAFGIFVGAASSGASDFGLVALLALTILGVSVANSFVAQILGSRIAVWLGEVSYSIYMIHFPILLVLRRVYEKMGYAAWSVPLQGLAFVAAIAIVIAAAAVLYHAIEKPMRTRLRDRMGVLASPERLSAR